MKGTFFQKPLELKLHIDGETWNQADSVAGRLEIKNLGSETVTLSDVGVHLALGAIRKVHQKAEGAFKPVNSKLCQGDLRSQDSASLDWKFETDLNCPITDTGSSLFLVYGKGEALHALGQLQLRIQPAPVVQEFLKALTIQFRFVVKSQKSTKRGVEVKFDPPSAQAFATLDHLSTIFRFEGETLQVHYEFHVKKISASSAALDVKSQTQELDQTFTPTQYRLPSGRYNFERIEKGIQEAISLVESKIVY